MSDNEDDVPSLLEHPEPPAVTTRVPLTIISGFLGAGKSTLLKRILTERHGYRIAVIMNEFGDTADIESKTINVSSADDPTAENSEEFLELANGCLCCSIKDTGIAAIEKLMLRKGAFDHILLETTGMADPGPIATMLWQNEEYGTGIGQDIALDGVICVVDAVFGRQQMEEDHGVDDVPDSVGESLRQIACADVILLNKVDMTTPSEIAATETIIQSINPTAPIHRTIRGEIDLKHVMGIGAYALPPKFQLAKDVPVTKAHNHDGEGECDDHDHKDDPPQPTHYELRGISSLQVSCPTLSPTRLDRIDEWIRTVLWEGSLPSSSSAAPSKLQILRCKGLFNMEDGTQRVLQGVRSMYEISKIAGSDGVTGVPDEGKLVLIGKGLEDPAVRTSLVGVLQD